MKKLLGLLLLVLVLASCEGTREPELPLVLVAADGGGLSFYRTAALREGDATPIGSWTVPGVVDLAGGEKLWVLTGTELRRYATDGFTPDASPGEGDALEAAWTIPGGCAGGHLALGAAELLVFCAPDRVYRLAKGADAGDPLPPVDTAAFQSFTPLDLALFPGDAGDRLAVAYARASGWHLELLEGSPPFSRDLPTPVDPVPLRLYLAPADGVLWALAGNELWRFDGSEIARKSTAQNARPARLTGDLGLVVAYGEGYLAWNGSRTEEVTYPVFNAGWLDPDLYLYLATDEGLILYDAAGLPLTRLRTLSLSGIRALSGFVLR